MVFAVIKLGPTNKRRIKTEYTLELNISYECRDTETVHFISAEVAQIVSHRVKFSESVL